MNESIKSQALNAVKWSALSKLYVSVVQLTQVAILTRFLAKEDFGLMGIAVLVNIFCGIFVDMGMSSAAMHQKGLTKQQFSSFYWLNLFLGFLLSVIISFSSPVIASFYHRKELIGIVALSSFTIFVHSIYSLLRTVQQKQMNFKFMSVVDILSASLAFVMNVFLVNQGLGVYSLVWAQLASGVLTAILFLIRTIVRERNILIHFNISDVTDALKIGIFQVGTSILDFFSREMDSLILSSNMSMELFGVYTLCKNVTMRIYQIINPIITNVLTPIYSKMQDEKDRLTDIYKRSVEVLGFINFPIYGIVAVGSSSFMAILYGDSYRIYAYVMFFLSIYYAFQSCGNPIGSLLIATGRTDRGFYWTIFRILFTLICFSIASQLNLLLFVIFIAVSPIITSYPFWLITINKVCYLSFYDSLMLSLKPMFACLPMFVLFFMNVLVPNDYFSLILVSLLFIIGYYLTNKIFRPNLQIYVLTSLKSEVKRTFWLHL